MALKQDYPASPGDLLDSLRVLAPDGLDFCHGDIQDPEDSPRLPIQGRIFPVPPGAREAPALHGHPGPQFHMGTPSPTPGQHPAKHPELPPFPKFRGEPIHLNQNICNQDGIAPVPSIDPGQQSPDLLLESSIKPPQPLIPPHPLPPCRFCLFGEVGVIGGTDVEMFPLHMNCNFRKIHSRLLSERFRVRFRVGSPAGRWGDPAGSTRSRSFPAGSGHGDPAGPTPRQPPGPG